MPNFTQKMRSLTQHIHLAELVKKITDETSFRQNFVRNGILKDP